MSSVHPRFVIVTLQEWSRDCTCT